MGNMKLPAKKELFVSYGRDIIDRLCHAVNKIR